MAQFKLTAAFLSDIGMRRKQNQDSGLARPDLGLFLVADGMGGHQGGEAASKLCVEKIESHIAQYAHTQNNDTALLQQGVMIANQSIFELSQKDSSLSGMGTTTTVLKISNNLATIAQAGDSRAYYWNKDGIWQITRDHSLVQEKLRAGLITREQVKTDDMKNVITRSVGYEMNVKTDIYTMEVEPGDHFLICSDGLSGPVDDDLMFDILEESAKSGLSLEDTAKRLIQKANERGGDDNSTVVLVQIDR